MNAKTEKLTLLAEAILTELAHRGGAKQKCNHNRKTSHEAQIKGKKMPGRLPSG